MSSFAVAANKQGLNQAQLSKDSGEKSPGVVMCKHPRQCLTEKMRDPRVMRARGSMRAQGGGPRSVHFTSPLMNPSAVNHLLR